MLSANRTRPQRQEPALVVSPMTVSFRQRACDGYVSLRHAGQRPEEIILTV
jgi:hypothetical protein